MKRDLVSIADLTRTDIERLLDRAAAFDAIEWSGGEKLTALRGRLVVSMFYESSTRTSMSFDLAAKRLGADVMGMKAAGSSVDKGESLRDTVQTLDQYGPSAFVVRHPHAGAAAQVASFTEASVVNAGDGKHEHPTQALLDLFALRRRLGSLDGLRIWIVGDVLHSRVARSNIIAMRTMGCEVTLCGPPTLIPRGIEALGCRVATTLDGLAQADVVYALRMQNERMASGYVPSLREYVQQYQIDRDRLGSHQLLMHPGPVNRGVELADDVVDDPRSLILEQVQAGVLVRMAVLEELLCQAPADGADPATALAKEPMPA
jgi:aspartate carbamoyltransferase catalytic subunit